MSEWLLLVDVTVDPEVEENWNHWYDNEHLPEIVDCPGFVSGARYHSRDESGVKYLTVYEVSGPEALQSAEFQQRRGWGSYASYVRPKVTLYQKLGDRSEK